MACYNCNPRHMKPGGLIKATKDLKRCAVCGKELSPEIAKARFEKLKKDCPGFIRILDEFFCRAIQEGGRGLLRKGHCCEKNCAPLYWIKNMKQEEL